METIEQNFKTAKKELNLKLEVFEGPLDLLMHLIEKNKIDIYDIQIALITEQYLAYLNAMQHFDMEIASEFLVMAANLIQIKSRMLLPKQPFSEQDPEEEDPLRELADRLLLYREFKQAAVSLEQMGKAREKCFTRYPKEMGRYVTLPDDLVINHLVMAFARLLESVDADYALISREEISVHDKIQDILILLEKNGGTLEFVKTIFRHGGKNEIIASFLAILELIRLKKISVVQESGFSPIFLKVRRENVKEQE
jgi:segregation and condensation protein A